MKCWVQRARTKGSIPLRNCDFTEDTLTKFLDKVKVNKITDPNCTAPRVLKEAKYQIDKPLVILFNKFLNSGSLRHLEIGKCYPHRKGR